MKNVPAMSKKQEPHFLRGKSSAKEKRSPGQPSFLESDDYKKLPARFILQATTFLTAGKEVLNLFGGGEPSGPPAPAGSGTP